METRTCRIVICHRFLDWVGQPCYVVFIQDAHDPHLLDASAACEHDGYHVKVCWDRQGMSLWSMRTRGLA